MQQIDFGFAGTAGATARTRAPRREADWRRQLARGFVYATEKSPEQAAELLAEYERRGRREGPDFMRIRPGSIVAEASTRRAPWRSAPRRSAPLRSALGR